MSTPLVSVILPVYNAEKYVGEAIESILNQSFSNFELIIINDGSSDYSEKVILSFKDSRIIYIKNETNLKLIATLNLGLKLAQGKYIARIDADDLAMLDRLTKQVDFLDKHQDYGLIGTFAKLFGSEVGSLEYVQDDSAIRYALLTHNPFIHSTVMFRNSIIKNYKLCYEDKQIYVEDYDLWIRILSFTKGKLLPEYLVNYRVHSSQISSIYKELQVQNVLLIQKKYFLNEFSELKNVGVLCSIFFSENVDVHSKYLAWKDFKNNFEMVQSKFKIKIRKIIQKNIKNSVLEMESISFTDFLILLKLHQFFTLKQKLALFLKLFKK